MEAHLEEEKSEELSEKQRSINKSVQSKWIHDTKMMQKRYDIVDKQISSLFRSGNVLANDMKDIFDWLQVMETDTMKESDNLANDVKNMTVMVNRFQKILENDSKDPKFLEKMTKLGEKIEDKLMEFKTTNIRQGKKMSTAENTLFKEVQSCLERFEAWNTDTDDRQSTVKANRPKPRPVRYDNESESDHSDSDFHSTFKQIQSNISRSVAPMYTQQTGVADARPIELIEIQTALDEFGSCGGWPRRDHDDFVKFHTKITDDRKLLLHLSEVLPHYSLTDLREHLQWYDSHLRLWEKKKAIIAKWKTEKKRMKAVEKESQNNDHIKLLHEFAQKKKQEKLHNKEQRSKKLQIQKWKDEKERMDKERQLKQSQTDAKERKLRAQQAKQRVREQKRRLREMEADRKIKELSESYKNMASECKLSMNKETNRKNKELLKKFKEKDMKIVRQRKGALQLREERKKAEKEKLDKLIEISKPKLNVSNDRQRLSALTAVAKKRVEINNENMNRNNSKPTKFNRSLFLGDSSGRSVPSWRSGV